MFGGGHVVLPLLQAQVVPPGWIGNDAFLAGYAAAQVMPGPLFTFAAFLGAAIPLPGGVTGAAVALVGIFLPAFLLVLGALPLWQGALQRPALRSAVAGVNAGVVGVLLAALVTPVATTALTSAPDGVLALAALGALLSGRVPVWIACRGVRRGGRAAALGISAPRRLVLPGGQASRRCAGRVSTWTSGVSSSGGRIGRSRGTRFERGSAARRATASACFDRLGLHEGQAGEFEHRLQLVDRQRRRLGRGQRDGRRHRDHFRSAQRRVAGHGDRGRRHDEGRRRPCSGRRCDGGRRGCHRTTAASRRSATRAAVTSATTATSATLAASATAGSSASSLGRLALEFLVIVGSPHLRVPRRPRSPHRCVRRDRGDGDDDDDALPAGPRCPHRP